MKRLYTFILLSLLSISGLVAGDWYVCIGSYAKIGNAQKICDELSASNLSALIYEYENPNGGTLYRVLINEPYKNRDEARAHISVVEKNPYIVKKNIKGLWIVEVEGNPFVYMRTTPKKKTTTTSEKKPVAEAKPEPQPEPKQEAAAEPVQEQANIEETESTAEISEGDSTEAETESESADENAEAETDEQESEGEGEAEADEQEEAAPETPEVNIPETVENPYSVLVRSYREEDKANFDCERLNGAGVNSYVLKKFDDKSFFQFDLHAGEFKTEEEAENYRATLEEAKLKDTQVSNYADYYESLKNYAIISASEEIVANVGQPDFPKIITDGAAVCINQLPANKNFQIVEAYICDFEKSRKNNFDYKNADFPELLTRYAGDEKISSAAFVTYCDELYNKEVLVFVAASSTNQSDEIIKTLFPNYKASDDKSAPEKLTIPTGTIDYKMFNVDESVCLFGSTEDNSLTIAMKAVNFDATEISEFLENSYSGETIAIYPQIKRSLFILPTDEITPREFLSFSLKKVDSEYAASRKDIDWAIATIGQWDAHAYFSQEGHQIFFSLFDFNYEQSSNRVHKMFMDERNTKEVNDANHLEFVHSQKGWYIETEKYKELSFCNKSYNIAIDCDINSDVTLDDLHIMADDILIW